MAASSSANAEVRMEDAFEVLYQDKLGEGQYGKVFRARHRETGDELAVKELAKAQFADPAHAGIPATAMKEVAILKRLQQGDQHPNIIKFHGVHMTNSTVHIWTELCKGTVYHLQKALRDAAPAGHDESRAGAIPAEVVRWWMFAALSALERIHAEEVVHRDLKPENLFLSAAGVLKVADFGLARQLATANQHTEEIVTVWYRPPDVLLGNRAYGYDIDIWPLGCILGEMLTGHALFPGSNALQQLQLIFDCLPVPSVAKTYASWEQLHTELPLDNSPTRTSLGELCGSVDEDALDLIQKMLQCDPSARISVREALEHPYFEFLDQEEPARQRHLDTLLQRLDRR